MIKKGKQSVTKVPWKMSFTKILWTNQCLKGTEKGRRNMSAWFGRIVFPFILGYGFYQLLKPG